MMFLVEYISLKLSREVKLVSLEPFPAQERAAKVASQ